MQFDNKGVFSVTRGALSLRTEYKPSHTCDRVEVTLPKALTRRLLDAVKGLTDYIDCQDNVVRSENTSYLICRKGTASVASKDFQYALVPLNSVKPILYVTPEEMLDRFLDGTFYFSV